jgi:hypothetical protein
VRAVQYGRTDRQRGGKSKTAFKKKDAGKLSQYVWRCVVPIVLSSCMNTKQIDRRILRTVAVETYSSVLQAGFPLFSCLKAKTKFTRCVNEDAAGESTIPFKVTARLFVCVCVFWVREREGKAKKMHASIRKRARAPMRRTGKMRFTNVKTTHERAATLGALLLLLDLRLSTILLRLFVVH